MASATMANSPCKLEGDYFEGCNCNVTCPCIFKGDPDNFSCRKVSTYVVMNYLRYHLL